MKKFLKSTVFALLFVQAAFISYASLQSKSDAGSQTILGCRQCE